MTCQDCGSVASEGRGDNPMAAQWLCKACLRALDGQDDVQSDYTPPQVQAHTEQDESVILARDVASTTAQDRVEIISGFGLTMPVKPRRSRKVLMYIGLPEYDAARTAFVRGLTNTLMDRRWTWMADVERLWRGDDGDSAPAELINIMTKWGAETTLAKAVEYATQDSNEIEVFSNNNKFAAIITLRAYREQAQQEFDEYVRSWTENDEKTISVRNLVNWMLLDSDHGTINTSDVAAFLVLDVEGWLCMAGDELEQFLHQCDFICQNGQISLPAPQTDAVCGTWSYNKLIREFCITQVRSCRRIDDLKTEGFLFREARADDSVAEGFLVKRNGRLEGTLSISRSDGRSNPSFGEIRLRLARDSFGDDMIISTFKPFDRSCAIVRANASRQRSEQNECEAAAVVEIPINETIMGVEEDPIPNVTEVVEAFVEEEFRDSTGKKRIPELWTKQQFKHWQEVALKAYASAQRAAEFGPSTHPLQKWSIQATAEFASEPATCWICVKKGVLKGQLNGPSHLFDHLIASTHLNTYEETFNVYQ